MTNSNRLLVSAGAAIAVMMGAGSVCTSSAIAADSAFYVGGGYGMSRIDNADFDDDTNVLKAFVGGKFMDYFGVEAAALDYGSANDNDVKSDLTGYTVAAIGFLPFTESFEGFINVGNLWWENDIRLLGLKYSFDGQELFYGAGFNFYFNKALALRVELERYAVQLSDNEVGMNIDEDIDVDVASVGVVFNF